MVEAVAEYDYTAKEPNELSITKGDIIRDVNRKHGRWLEGTLNDRKGVFPDTCVTLLDKEAPVVLRNKKDATRIRQCRVIFSYKQDHEDELNLNVGDVIDILGEEEEGWWRGVLNGREGVFPSNFVEEINGPAVARDDSIEEPLQLPSKPSKILCEVKYAYRAQNDDELTLKVGDIVTLITKDGQDPGWWKGELNGVVGVFPDNFVAIINGTDTLSPALQDDRASKSTSNNNDVNFRPNVISSQRKSLEVKQAADGDLTTAKTTTPPLPGKKPSLPIKKSPSGSGSGAGYFFGLKKKIVDVVDGATGSKSSTKADHNAPNQSENVFDDVVRRSLLPDVRATRPKAPGRRPPSVVFREGNSSDLPSPGVVNGNVESLEVLNEQQTPAQHSEVDATNVEGKSKLKEWEKHKAPWLEEMKLNQAKRTSTSPGPENKLKLTPTDKSETEKFPSPVETARTKTPPVEDKNVVLRAKNNNYPPTGSRPQTIQTVGDVNPKGYILKTPSPSLKYGKDAVGETIGQKQYLELIERIVKLEERIEKQNLAIEELRGKLQLETDMRMALQAKLENV